MVSITKKKIDPQQLLRLVRSKKFGGIVLFLGEVRNQSSDGHRGKVSSVIRLEYSAYEPMAVKQMNQIKNEILRKWRGKGMGKTAMVHRIGRLKVGEIAVAVAVSAVHRSEAFEACRAAIDQIKKKVPVFKKEFFSDGKSHWVGCG